MRTKAWLLSLVLLACGPEQNTDGLTGGGGGSSGGGGGSSASATCTPTATLSSFPHSLGLGVTGQASASCTAATGVELKVCIQTSFDGSSFTNAVCQTRNSSSADSLNVTAEVVCQSTRSVRVQALVQFNGQTREVFSETRACRP